MFRHVAVDTILGTRLARLAVESSLAWRDGRPAAANLIRDCLEETERLAQQCQMTEFTEHGLPHLQSLIDRIDTWTGEDGVPLVSQLSHDEAFCLLFAVITHDIGMLAQRETDLPEGDRVRYAPLFADLPTWVRRTHVMRIERILERILLGEYSEFVTGPAFRFAVSLARSHQFWPGTPTYAELRSLAVPIDIRPDRAEALGGVLGVADLLDEDSSRCDSMTLFANKAGTLMNRAHWLRHILTGNTLCVTRGCIAVQFRVPSNLADRIQGALTGLRNHLTQCRRYNPVLAALDAKVRLEFAEPLLCEAVPADPALAMLLSQPELHLLRTFSLDSLPAANSEHPAGSEVKVNGIELLTIDRGRFDQAMGYGGSFWSGEYPVSVRAERPMHEPSDYEITYLGASLAGDAPLEEAWQILGQAACEADRRGDIGLVRQLAGVVLERRSHPRTHRLAANNAWAGVYMVHWARSVSDLTLIEDIVNWDRRQIWPKAQPAAFIEKLSGTWRLVALTTTLLLGRSLPPPWNDLTWLVETRLREHHAMSHDEAVAWHDLIETHWATGYFLAQHANFWPLFLRLAAHERKGHTEAECVLLELAWRISVQSHCLSGYGMWEYPQLPGSRERRDYGLSDDLGRESMAALWTAWFHGTSEDASTAAKAACRANGKGTQFYAPALEGAWMATISTLEGEIWWSAHRTRYENGEAREKDPAYELIHAGVAQLSSLPREQWDPTGSTTNALDPIGSTTLILGQRVALRRWYLESWCELAGAHLGRMVAKVNEQWEKGLLEKRLLMESITRLPWCGSFAFNSYAAVRNLVDRHCHLMRDTDLDPLLSSLQRSPRRIANLEHPGLKLLGDALPAGILPLLVQWTDERLAGRFEYGPETFLTWGNFLGAAAWPVDTWTVAQPVIEWSLALAENYSPYRRVLEAVLQLAPWELAGPYVRRIGEAVTNSRRGWGTLTRCIAAEALLVRTDKQRWHNGNDIQPLLAALRAPDETGRSNPEDCMIADVLSAAEPAAFSAFAEHLVQSLESVRTRSKEILDRNYIPRPILDAHPPVATDLARRGAAAYAAMWRTADYTPWELGFGSLLAGLLLSGTTGAGLRRMLQAYSRAMRRPHLGLVNGPAAGTVELLDCSQYAWTSLARHLRSVPPSFVKTLSDLIQVRIMDLPVESLWAVGSLVAALGQAKSLDPATIHALLLCVRGRTAGSPNSSAAAFAAVVRRLCATGHLPNEAAYILPMLAGWANEASSAPDSAKRRETALACRRLKAHIPGAQANPFQTVFQRFQHDASLGVRYAAIETASN